MKFSGGSFASTMKFGGGSFATLNFDLRYGKFSDHKLWYTGLHCSTMVQQTLSVTFTELR